MDSLFGTVINTAFPKFDWANETEVIKQSLSVFIVMFGGMIIALLAYAATFALTIFVDPIIALITLFALYSGLDILLYNILIKDSARRFDKTNV